MIGGRRGVAGGRRGVARGRRGVARGRRGVGTFTTAFLETISFTAASHTSMLWFQAFWTTVQATLLSRFEESKPTTCGWLWLRLWLLCTTTTTHATHLAGLEMWCVVKATQILGIHLTSETKLVLGSLGSVHTSPV